MQDGAGTFTQTQCNAGRPPASQQTYSIFGCPTPTPSPTPSGTPTATATATATSTATATATATIPPQSPTPTPCLNYSYTLGTDSFVPGTVDTGNHTDDGSTVIPLPFSYNLYDQSFTNVAVGSNGHLTFGTVSNAFGVTCIPVATATYAIGPYWGDQRTDNVGGRTGCGIFTTTTGIPPFRTFIIEWRTIFFGEPSLIPTQNYEVKLYEGLTDFDVIFNLVTPKATANDSALSVGVQKNTGQFTLVGCDPTGANSRR